LTKFSTFLGFLFENIGKKIKMAPKVPTTKMSNCVDLPLFGLGTWQAKDDAELKAALENAINAGYRYIDTAQIYGNEDIIGEFFEEKFKNGQLCRSDIFITTKLAPVNHQPEKAEKAILKSLENLRTDYIDLFLIHMPFPMETVVFTEDGIDSSQSKTDTTPLIDTWRVLEKYYNLGKLKAIGISNFNQKQIQELYDQAEIKPHNIQVECHILRPQHELEEFCKKLLITGTSYSTIGSPGRGKYGDTLDVEPMEVPLVLELAKKYNKTPAQILLRQMVQRGISVIPKSVKPERLQENINIFDFEFTPEEMKKFDEITIRQKLFSGFWERFKNHPFYPAEGV